ncbi:hypothetical protein [Acinetobacter baumannii]|uniref:hypothetical protein n=1 Tax=Acinetobacter baumannii TaxID=470 RepID=UPI0028CC1A86|nr:hypothetical protein [Acinetobacter baumannii]MDT8014618.1 hypothetical protein [Acinetobacter baumannii]
MNLEYTHKPDYYLFAQLLVRHIESYIHKHPDADNAIFDLRDVYEIFLCTRQISQNPYPIRVLPS